MENYGNGYEEYVVTMNRTQYGLYQDSVQLSISVDEEKWKKAVFWVFDVPEIAEKPFEVRNRIFSTSQKNRKEWNICNNCPFLPLSKKLKQSSAMV
jgi:hypothetical protein